MLKDIENAQSIAILGFGREGRSTYELIRKRFPGLRITIADQNKDIIHDFDQNPESRTVFKTGPNYLEGLDEFDLIFRSPGIYLQEYSENEILRNCVSSQTDLFLQYFSRQTIGVTGTKGKSTTSALIHHILKNSGRKTVLVGNIGVPPFDVIEQIDRDTLIVFELSSQQLEDIHIAPHISIILNLYDEHLDRYGTSEAYHRSKMQIFNAQHEGDHLIYNLDDNVLSSYIEAHYRQYFTFSLTNKHECSAYFDAGNIYLSEQENNINILPVDDSIPLRGKHNISNIMAAMLACRAAGLSFDEMIAGIRTFKGLEHRMEFIGKYGNILFYNDSIATIPEATIEAIRALEKVDTIILGGHDRKRDYSTLYDTLVDSQIRNVMLIGPAGKRMHDDLAQKENHDLTLFPVENLQEAFEFIPKITKPGHICLLSPAAASYDAYKNFEARGAEFKRLAKSV